MAAWLRQARVAERRDGCDGPTVGLPVAGLGSAAAPAAAAALPAAAAASAPPAEPEVAEPYVATYRKILATAIHEERSTGTGGCRVRPLADPEEQIVVQISSLED